MAKFFETIIIGAGASGLMAGVKLKHKNIAILEKSSKIGEKIKISGGGRCNITNSKLSAKNYLGDEEFVKEVLKNFDNRDLLNFLKTRGLTTQIKKNTQYFCKKSSNELLELFKNELKKTKIFFNHTVLEVKKDKLFQIITNCGVFESENLVVASGGLSYKSLGASDISFEIARNFGHKIVTLNPALVGFTLQPNQFWFKNLSGVSMNVEISVQGRNFREFILFAHKGMSGPAILNSSLYWEKGLIKIDFLPNDPIKKFLNSSNKLISSALPLPKSFIKEFLKSINLEDKAISKLTSLEREKLQLLKSYNFSPAGNFGYTKAEVTKGGICTDEIDFNTMMSKIVKNLFFLGENLNITGELGGYNFQWAFSSAMRLNLKK